MERGKRIIYTPVIPHSLYQVILNRCKWMLCSDISYDDIYINRFNSRVAIYG